MRPPFLVTCLALLASVPALASPVVLSRSGFGAALAPLTAVVESFESYATGFTAPTIALANATYTSNAPYIGAAFGSASKVLTNQTVDAPLRAFSNLGAGVQVFGLDLFAILSSDILEVTVVSLDGVYTFSRSMNAWGSFVGIQDASGLLGVRFRNVGNANGVGNYSFDNVTTGASATGVPEPASLALVAVALAGLGASRRRGARCR